MNLKILVYAIAVILLSSAVSFAQEVNTCSVQGISPYRDQKISFKKEDLRLLLQDMAYAIYQKGFRYLGDPRDFDHGHILSYVHNLKPFAILYHTQEDAFNYHITEPMGPYDYLDTGARNWIQWLDTGKIENAYKYQRHHYYSNELADVLNYSEHFTVSVKMLDKEKIGGEIASSEQFHFIDSGLLPEKCSVDTVRIELPGGRFKNILFLDIENYWNFYNSYFYWLK